MYSIQTDKVVCENTGNRDDCQHPQIKRAEVQN